MNCASCYVPPDSASLAKQMAVYNDKKNTHVTCMVASERELLFTTLASAVCNRRSGGVVDTGDASKEAKGRIAWPDGSRVVGRTGRAIGHPAKTLARTAWRRP